MKHLLTILFLVFMANGAYAGTVSDSVKGNPQKGNYFLYCHMSQRGQWTAFAISKDGLHYHDIINGDSIFSSRELAGIEGGTRDAYICRSHDGKRYLMVTTDMNNSMTKALGKKSDWDNYGIDLLTSDDLIHWKSTTFDFRKGLDIFCTKNSVYKDWSTINRVWAPQIFWDNSYVWPNGDKGGYFIYYSLWNRAEEKYDRMYYSYADESFTKLTAPQLLFDWGYATIDADINYVPADSMYHMMIKKEGGTTGLFTTMSKSLTGPWPEPLEDDYVNFEGKKKCEGVSAFQIPGEDGWRIAYIEYSSRPTNYRICKADKFMRHFSSPQNIEGVNGPQHGSFMRITEEEYNRLQSYSDSLEAQHIHANVNNPVIPGLYADPEIMWSESTKKYYLYPTTDGCIGWNNHDFHVYSSPDLKTWTKEGVVLDLTKDVTWAHSRAWAPCAIEVVSEGSKGFQKVSKGFKTYYYFVAEGKIGVAVGKTPAGPFKDALGKPLVSTPPAGEKGQTIDPDVFQDPKTGKYYLYYGNSFLAVQELNNDMISFKDSAKVLIHRADKRKYNYNEGTYVFYRNGLYYFMWSENDTRSALYRVRYLISDSPTEFIRNGKPAMPEKTIVLQQDPSKQIFGTGHHSVIQKVSGGSKGSQKVSGGFKGSQKVSGGSKGSQKVSEGNDEWYICYHRFARPNSIKLGWDAGYNREVCIDRLEFNEDGTIKPVTVTY